MKPVMKYSSYALLVLLTAVVLAGCLNPIHEKSATDKGLVTIWIGGGLERTLIPTPTFTRYELSISGEGREPLFFSSGNASRSIELDPGTYLVTAKGFVNISGTEYEAASGSKTITVAAGSSTGVTIPISSRNDIDEPDGFFSYDIRLQLDKESLSEATLILSALSESDDYKQEFDLKDDTAENGLIPLIPGYYLLKIQLKSDFRTTGRTEVVHIYSGQETRAEYTFKSGDFIIPEPAIYSYRFPASETGLAADLKGKIEQIDEENYTITIATLEWIENIGSLKALFEADGEVTVEDQPQSSGNTPNNFRQDVVYTVITPGHAANYYTVVFESPQTTGLPVIKIDTQGGAAINTKTTYVQTNIALFDPNNPANNFASSGYKDRIRGRGNATWDYAKKPYKIKLDKKTDILGMGSDKDWVLLANYCDKTLLRTAIAFKTSELLAFPWTPKAHFVEVFLNDQYLGNYQIVEGIKQDSNRVNIPKDTGFIIERDGYYKQEPIWFETDNVIGYSFKHPDADDLTESDPQYIYIKDYMNEFEEVLASPSFADPDEGYQKYIDIDSWVRWFLFQNIIANMDTNPYLTKDDSTANSKLKMGPVWDFEWSLGIGWYDGPRPRPADYWVCNEEWWYYSKLLTDSVFVGKLQNMWNTSKNGIKEGILQYIEEARAEIIKSQEVNFRRWNIMNIRVSVGGIPLGSFGAEVDCDKEFFINHFNWLDTAINGL
jgi:hypothetical protein